MIHVIVVTHSDVATHLVESAERVMGKQENLAALNLHLDASLEQLTETISGAMRACQTSPPPQGILILTDLYGNSATNASLAQVLHAPCPVNILTGVNLPMMISCLTYRGKMTLEDLTRKVAADGQKGIRNALTSFSPADARDAGS